MTVSVLLELVRHKTWATLQVFELCERLAPEMLDTSVAGTYGSVRSTLRHLVAADERYFHLLTNESGSPPAEDTTLQELAERFRALAPRWEVLLRDEALAEREFAARVGITLGVAPMAQSIHHADVHRAHVLSALGAEGVEVPEFDVWDFGTVSGYVRPPATAG
jgi:uncharacterized damage-inducible protein DinB